MLAEEFARAKAPLRADFFGDTLVGPTILQWGTEEQKKEFLPKILRGEMRWCQGFCEPDSGSDLASLKTTAVLDGDEWVINGQKVWTTQGHHADYCFLLAPHRSRGARSTRASRTCWCRCSSPASRCAASPSPTARPSSARCSSPTPAARRTTSSAASTTAGRWPTPRSASSAGSRPPPATAASRRSTGCIVDEARGERRDRRPRDPPAPRPRTTAKCRSCASTACARCRRR